jgi:hypothetical protein
MKLQNDIFHFHLDVLDSFLIGFQILEFEEEFFMHHHSLLQKFEGLHLMPFVQTMHFVVIDIP